jgi:hypothetical protein
MTAARPRYRERQVVQSDDLTAQQAYLTRMRRRHELGQHRWGIVTGLELAVAPGGFTILAGLAVDGMGRQLVVADPVVLPESLFDQLGANRLDLWLRYRRVAESPAGPGNRDCGPGRNDRWLDEALVTVATAGRDPVNPWTPPGVPSALLGAGAAAAEIDDPGQPWPVYLGRVARTAAGSPLSVVPTVRVLASLAAEQLASPSTEDRAVWDRLQVGAEAPGDQRRFAVRLRDGKGALVDRWTVDRRGATSVTGDVDLQGNLLVARTPDRPPADPDSVAGGLRLLASATPPAQAAPWRIYHTTAVEDGTPVDQLRVEIGHPGDTGDPATHRLVIGQVGRRGQFLPCLVVTSGGEVIVRGDLNARRLVMGSIQADPDNPAFTAAVAGAWTQGLASPGALVDNLRSDALAVTVNVPGPVAAGRPPRYTATVRNTGSTPLSYVAVFESLLVGGTVARRGWIAAGLSLAAGGSRIATPRSDPLNPPGQAGDVLSVGVLALGIRPVNDLVVTTTKAVETLQ